MTLTDMFGSIGLTGVCVLGCLALISLYSVALIVDKLRRFRAASSQSTEFLVEFDHCLRQGKLQSAVVTAQRHKGSHVARVVAAGVAEMIESDGPAVAPEARVGYVSRALERSTDLTLADMKKGLGSLATIGSTAPFIGLFGTVVGIIHAFQGIAASGSGGIAAVSGGIAEALVATALGILVATPAVMAFNYFTGTLERFRLEIRCTAAELVDFVSKREQAAHASH